VRSLRPAIALELLLTGDPISAERAEQIGLVNRPTAEGGALEGALALAEAVAVNGPLAVAATREVARQSVDWTLAELWTRQDAIIRPVFDSEDAKEGATAFARSGLPSGRAGDRCCERAGR